jgi:hypothetical protein
MRDEVRAEIARAAADGGQFNALRRPASGYRFEQGGSLRLVRDRDEEK